MVLNLSKCFNMRFGSKSEKKRIGPRPDNTGAWGSMNNDGL